MKKKLLSSLAIACSALVALSGCASSNNNAGGGGDEAKTDLVIGMALGDLATLDPSRVLADAMQLVIPMYSDTLVDVNQDDPREITPGLATEWEAADDLTSYTFKLRDDITFASGNQMTAKDVEFSLMRIKNVQGASAFKMGNVESMEVIDDYTVRFNLTGPDSSFPSRMTAPYLAVLDSTVLQENGGVSDETAVDADTAQEFLDSTTIGTGPYELKSWNRNQDITFTLRDGYWGDAPKFETVTVRDIRDASTQRQLVERGDIDIAMDIDPDTAASLDDVSGVNVVREQSYNLNYIALSDIPSRPEMQDLRVRQAIQKVIDYDGISAALADGAPRPAAVVPIGFLGADQVDVVETDVEGAKKLMAEAGVAPFEMDVTFANVIWYGVSQQALWEKLKADLSQIDITLNLVPAEYANWIAAYRATELPITSGLWAPEDFDSSSYFDPFGREDGIYGVRTNMDFPIGQELYEKYLSEKDADAREAIAVEYITAMRDSAWLIPIVQPNKIFVHSDAVENVRYSPDSQIRLAEVTPAQ
ncbi:MAG: ABC transporter substrate-binding protein [Leucobacter sp.]